MAEFHEITAQQALVSILAPLLKDKLGVLKDGNGDLTSFPAIYLGSNFVPESTLPRVIINYQGSSPDFITSTEVSQEVNPDYDSSDETSQEYLYYLTRYYHIEYILTLTADSGDAVEVLMGNRDSSASILRYVRKLLQRESVRDQVHTNMMSGVDSVMPETVIDSLDGVTRVDGSNLLINFTYCDEDKELLDGTINSVEVDGTTTYE